MSAPIELDEQRRSALAKLARRRKLPLRRVLERAVDEFIDTNLRAPYVLTQIAGQLTVTSLRLSVILKRKRRAETAALMLGTPTPVDVMCS